MKSHWLKHHGKSALRPRALRVEQLEQRYLLAVVTVDTLSDTVDFSDAKTSLREALFVTNIVDGPDTINFAPALTANGPAAIHLTGGTLGITGDLTINGPGAGLLTIDAGGSPLPDHPSGDSIFGIGFRPNGGPDLNVSLSGMTLTGANVYQQGGAIYSAGNLTVDGCSFVGNIAGTGGAIFSQFGTLKISNSKFDRNSARGGGGGGGGAVWKVDGSLAISNSIFTENKSLGNSGGALMLSNANTNISNCTFVGNASNSSGGAIYASRSEISLMDTTITNNTSVADGGGVYGTDSYITATNVKLSNNSAGGVGGGMIDFNGRIVLESSLVSNNHAVNNGGGISATFATLSIANSTISGNKSGLLGGGVFSQSSDPATILNSTITGNSAFGYLGSPSAGGGIYSTNVPLVIRNSIVAGNIFSRKMTDNDVNGLAQVFYSILGTNAGTNLAEAPVGSPDAQGNLIGGAINGAIDPLLGPLANNGGTTLTHALLPGSPAINAGDPAAMEGVANVPSTDQRGEPFARIAGGRIDMGAFESQPNPLPGDYDFNGTVDEADYDVWRASMSSTTDLRADGNGNGIVDVADFILWRENVGRTRIHLPPIVEQHASTESIVVPHSELISTVQSSVESVPANSKTITPIVLIRASTVEAGTRPRSIVDSPSMLKFWSSLSNDQDARLERISLHDRAEGMNFSANSANGREKALAADGTAREMAVDSALTTIFKGSSLGVRWY